MCPIVIFLEKYFSIESANLFFDAARIILRDSVTNAITKTKMKMTSQNLLNLI